MPWNDETGIEEVNGLFERLFSLSKHDRAVACRGQADRSWLLRTSLDRLLDPNADYVWRLAEEAALVERFRVQAGEYLDRIEKQFMNGREANSRISVLAVLQHHHAPTRLLDWTYSPWVALYFAAIHQHDKDGAVWWFSQESFEEEVGRRWGAEYDMELKYRAPEPSAQIDLDRTAFIANGPPWITGLHYPVPFHRIEVQQGFFTVAGRLGLEHGERIADVFDRKDISGGMLQGDRQYARIIIPASWKQGVLNRLRTMNIHSKSLDYPGADLVGIQLGRRS